MNFIYFHSKVSMAKVLLFMVYEILWAFLGLCIKEDHNIYRIYNKKKIINDKDFQLD